MKTFNHPKASISIVTGEESISIPTNISDVMQKVKTLPKLDCRTLSQRTNSIDLRSSAKRSSMVTIAE